jgi:hypothetical protein
MKFRLIIKDAGFKIEFEIVAPSEDYSQEKIIKLISYMAQF